jgi:hypothetical protein
VIGLFGSVGCGGGTISGGPRNGVAGGGAGAAGQVTTSPNHVAGSAAIGGRAGVGGNGGIAQGGAAVPQAGAGGQNKPASGSGGSGGGAAASSGELVNPAPGSKFFIGANFWNVDWEGAGDFFAKNVDWATTDNPWNPQFVLDLAPYTVLRFMDWNLINNDDNDQADWSTRKQPNEAQTELVAFEWQIDLCNRAKKDYWVNIPHKASQEYFTQLAMLIKAKLDPSLRVYVEWSNEVWNPGFPQHQYAQQQGNAMKLSGSDKAAAFQVYQSVRSWEAFEGVFGKGNPRLVKVLAGQAGGTNICSAHFPALKDKTINPNGSQPTAYAIAPYFQGESVDALTNDGIPEATGQVKDNYSQCTKAAGVPLIAYEGGQDSYSLGEQGCAQLQKQAGMHDVYTQFLDAISSANMTGPFMQYTHSGNCWGLKQRTSDANASSPKYQAVLDWLSKHP